MNVVRWVVPFDKWLEVPVDRVLAVLTESLLQKFCECVQAMRIVGKTESGQRQTTSVVSLKIHTFSTSFVTLWTFGCSEPCKRILTCDNFTTIGKHFDIGNNVRYTGIFHA